MKIGRSLVFAASVGALLIGCASPRPDTDGMRAPHELTEDAATENGGGVNAITFKPPKQRITPTVGSRNQDSRVILDNGVVLKIWMPSYVTPDNILHAAADLYVRVEEPRWVVGEPVPQRSKGLTTPPSGFPFNFRPDELDASSSPQNDADVAKYQEGVEKNYRDPNFAKQKDSADQFDAKILKFLNRKGEQK